MTESANSPPGQRVKFREFSLLLDMSFWFELERRKLEEWRLSEEPRTCRVFSILSVHRGPGQLSHLVNGHAGSFDPNYEVKNSIVSTLTLINFNTIEQLQAVDRREALREAGLSLLRDIQTRPWAEVGFTPVRMYSFADLKQHVYSSIVAFPALDLRSPIAAVAAPAVEALGAAVVDAAVAFARGGGGGAAGAFTVAPERPPRPLDATDAGEDGAMIVVCDGGVKEYPGWAARNIIAAVRLTHPTRTRLKLLLLRQDAEASVVLSCSFDALSEGDKDSLRTVGWHGSDISRIDASEHLDPVKRAESSARLNLYLMKWRMLPTLDLDRLSKMKALLLGSGTLGCGVARQLMMWGVVDITMVDRGNVSHSNPVRQTLFEAKDVGSPKCDAAVAALKRILPSVRATAVSLSIPMAGHRVDESRDTETRNAYEKLRELIRTHDVVFQLMDSRESRWLPTVLCASEGVPCINAALGFDSYMVMRHGMVAQEMDKRLGCYFCNDVVAPIDSLTARTLDQQCTVTRPGLSAMASAVAVELLAALVNHPMGFMAPATIDDRNDEGSVLGACPQQIRGSVRSYDAQCLWGMHYGKCIACSEPVLRAMGEGGYDFVRRVLNQPTLLEDLTGISADKKAMEMEDLAWDDE